MFKNKGISKNQNYSDDFQDWEIAIITKLIRTFQLEWDCLKGEEEFEDLRQECFIHWLHNRDKYDNSKGANQRTFMSKVIKNKLMDIVREKTRTDKRKIHTNLGSLSTPLSKDDDSSELIEIIEQDGFVQKDVNIHNLIEFNVQYSQVVKKLSPKQKKICDLALLDYTKFDIARLLEIPRTTLNDEFKRIEKIFTREGLKDFLK